MPFGFGLCEEAGLVVEPDRRMRVIGGQGVIVVEVDPKGLSYEDDVFAVRGVRRARWCRRRTGSAPTTRRRAMVPRRPGGLTIERLVSGLQREVGAGGSRRRGGRPDQHHARTPRRRSAGRLDIESNRADA